jgi:hypothetical protein
MTISVGKHSVLSDDDRTDYSVLLGFVTPPERIDPHVHVVSTPAAPDLRQVIEIVRDRRVHHPPENARDSDAK